MSLQQARRIGSIYSNNVYKLLIRLNHINHPGHKKKPYATPVRLTLPDRFLEEANYPPIKPKYPPGYLPSNSFDPEAEKSETKLAWHYFEEGQKYHSLKTIQERLSVLAYMNCQQTLDDLKERRTRFYPIYQLSSSPRAARMLPFNQYITKTHVSVFEKSENPEVIEGLNPDLYDKLKKSVEETILLNLTHRHDQIKEQHEPPVHPDTYIPECVKNENNLKVKLNASNQLIRDIFNCLTSILSVNEEHLANAQYGTDVNVKSYWKRCGFKEQKPRGAVNPDPDTIRFQFEDVACYQIKCEKPLKPVIILNFTCNSRKFLNRVNNILI